MGGLKKHKYIINIFYKYQKIRGKFVGRHQVELGYRLEVTVLFGEFTFLRISIT